MCLSKINCGREKKIDLYSTVRAVQNTIFDVRSERDLCNRAFFSPRIALLCGNEFCFLDAIEIGGAKLIKCHTQWNCDDKWPTCERLRLQIIDAAADIIFIQDAKRKEWEQRTCIHTHMHNNAAEKEPFAAMLTSNFYSEKQESAGCIKHFSPLCLGNF
jgi:hypothetical protein